MAETQKINPETGNEVHTVPEAIDVVVNLQRMIDENKNKIKLLINSNALSQRAEGEQLKRETQELENQIQNQINILRAQLRQNPTSQVPQPQANPSLLPAATTSPISSNTSNEASKEKGPGLVKKTIGSLDRNKGSIVAGAVLGTLFMPGLGTIAGAALGPLFKKLQKFESEDPKKD
jgi:hypothetical protein